MKFLSAHRAEILWRFHGEFQPGHNVWNWPRKFAGISVLHSQHNQCACSSSSFSPGWNLNAAFFSPFDLPEISSSICETGKRLQKICSDLSPGWNSSCNRPLSALAGKTVIFRTTGKKAKATKMVGFRRGQRNSRLRVFGIMFEFRQTTYHGSRKNCKRRIIRSRVQFRQLTKVNVSKTTKVSRAKVVQFVSFKKLLVIIIYSKLLAASSLSFVSVVAFNKESRFRFNQI